MRLPPPDIVLLAVDWKPRALIRAQLIEEGFEVMATDTWPMMRGYLTPGMKPRLAIVDLMGLPDPANVLKDLRALMDPDRVLVLAAGATVPETDIQRLGFHLLSRPIVIAQIVRAASSLIRSSSSR
jgi:DNA-binding response OmpR family regulator